MDLGFVKHDFKILRDHACLACFWGLESPIFFVWKNSTQIEILVFKKTIVSWESGGGQYYIFVHNLVFC